MADTFVEQRGQTALVLMQPRVAENIGAAARIACNFGIDRLIVVREDAPDQETMLKLATHKAADLIRNLELHQDLATALRPYHLVVGTTARYGRQRIADRSPRDVCNELRPFLGRQNIALLFGPENTGLTNAALDLCQFVAIIPTAGFSSLNLAQAVAILAYELFLAGGETSPAEAAPVEFANSRQLEGMYAHIAQVLATTGFLQHNDQAYWMRSIRKFFSRTRLRKKEATIIRGICRTFLWHHGVEQRKGLHSRGTGMAHVFPRPIVEVRIPANTVLEDHECR